MGSVPRSRFPAGKEAAGSRGDTAGCGSSTRGSGEETVENGVTEGLGRAEGLLAEVPAF